MKLQTAILMLTLLLLLGCVSYTPPAEQPKNETVTPPVTALSCSDLKDLKEGDSCYYNDAISKNNLTACYSIISNPLRDSCNLRFAVELNDSSLCARINGNDTKDDCYHTLAPKAGIITCNKIENGQLRRQCRMELGDDTVFCENKTETYDFKLCMAKARNNYSICLELDNISLIDSCYVDFAENKGIYPICSLPSDSGARDDCFKYFALLESNSSLCNKMSAIYPRYLCLTKVTGDYSLCNELTDYLQRDSCLEVFASERINHSICSNISTHLYQDRCYTNIALRSRNPNMCAYMTCYECVEDKDNCYYQMANLTADASLCHKITDTLNRDACTLDIAKSSHNPSICSTIESTYKMTPCFTTVIYNQPYETSACDNITQQNWKDECYKNAAIKRKNSTICDSIGDPFTKRDCVKNSV